MRMFKTKFLLLIGALLLLPVWSYEAAQAQASLKASVESNENGRVMVDLILTNNGSEYFSYLADRGSYGAEENFDVLIHDETGTPPHLTELGKKLLQAGSASITTETVSPNGSTSTTYNLGAIYRLDSGHTYYVRFEMDTYYRGMIPMKVKSSWLPFPVK